MDLYKNKYIKYKNKYLHLKNQNGGGDIFDFDSYFLDDDNKYISSYFIDNKINKQTLAIIKNNFQIFYKKYYEHLTNLSCEQIVIPLFADETQTNPNCNHDSFNIGSQFRVNYLEQAQYYNIEYKEKLSDIPLLEKILKDNREILLQKIRDLIQLNTSSSTIKLDDLLACLTKNISNNDFLFYNEHIIIKFIDKYKKILDIQYLKDNKKINFEENFLIDILREIKSKNKYKINDDYYLICLNKNDDAFNFISYITNKNIVPSIEMNDKLLNGLLKIYDTLGNNDITYQNITSILFFYKNIFKLNFRIIDNDFKIISDNTLDILKKINNDIGNKFNDTLLKIIKKIDKIEYINETVFTVIMNKFNEIFDDIKIIQNTIHSYYSLYQLKINAISLNITDIININAEQINNNIEQQKNDYIKYILGSYVNDDTKNDKVIEIDLQYIKKTINDKKQIEYEAEHHANLIILSKIYIGQKKFILGRRIEPHRHSNTYCRNSVRKEIRDIFDRIPNFYYMDFIMVSHYGLQTNECIDIQNKYISDLFNHIDVSKKCTETQLNNLDGFCASWCAYITSIILLNKNKSIGQINSYFRSFDLYKKSFIDTFIDKFKLANGNTELLGLLKHDFNKFYENEIFRYTITGFEYNYVKNLKLYTFILYYYSYLILNDNILNILIDNNDIDKINKFCQRFNKDEINIEITKNRDYKILLDNTNANDIKIIEKIKKYNKHHKCVDTIFDHTEFCLCNRICKPVSDNIKKLCEFTDERTEVCLKPMADVALSENEQEVYDKYLALNNELAKY